MSPDPLRSAGRHLLSEQRFVSTRITTPGATTLDLLNSSHLARGVITRPTTQIAVALRGAGLRQTREAEQK
ncbi:MAG TPA: hypothetical protein VF226_19445 [Hyphomicrobiaceae bacterium]|jgi:hypothetical protein